MTAKLSIHNVEAIEVERSKPLSDTVKDSHYTDFIIRVLMDQK